MTIRFYGGAALILNMESQEQLIRMLISFYFWGNPKRAFTLWKIKWRTLEPNHGRSVYKKRNITPVAKLVASQLREMG